MLKLCFNGLAGHRSREVEECVDYDPGRGLAESDIYRAYKHLHPPSRV